MSLKKTALSVACLTVLLSACSKPVGVEENNITSTTSTQSQSIQSASVAAMDTPNETATPVVVPIGATPEPAPVVQPKRPNQPQAEPSALDTELTNPALANKKLIINGSLNFEVADVRQTASYIQVLAGSHGGYVASESVHNERGRTEEVAIGDGKFRQMTEYTPTASLTVRIPKKEVNAFLQNLQTRIEFLIESSMDAKDASLEVKKAQLEAQISALKVSKLERLDDGVATAPNAINSRLNVAEKTAETQLSELYAKLSEQAIEDQVELATLRLDFFEHTKLHLRTTASLDSQLNKEKRANFSGRLKANLSVGWYYALEILLGLAKLWVFVLLIGFVWFGLPKLFGFIKARKTKNNNTRPVIHVPANPNPTNEPPKQ